MNTFDLTTISTQLPPNTGPAGTVPTNNGSNGSSNANKNLSHVPCKFYRQGACQAGSSCPFSHNFEGSLAAEKLPCKYFQKGNCKFGLKCALAHFLPDGTRVNSKNLRMSQPINTGVANGNGHFRRFSNNGNATFGHYTSQPIDINAESFDYAGHQTGTTLSPSNNVASFINVGNKFSSQPGSYTQDLNKESIFSSSFNGAASSYSNSATTSNSLSYPLKPGNQSSAFFRSYSFNASPTNQSSPFLTNSSSITYSNHSPISTPVLEKAKQRRISLASRSSFTSPTCLLNYDSAVIDDEDEEMYDDSGYFEDCVPGSLSELILTPKESERRGSRSQSGTLLVRPNLSAMLSSTTNEDDEKNEEDKITSNDDLKDKPEKNSAQEDVFLMD